MNKSYLTSKICLPYGAVLTTIFEAFDVPITDDDEVIKLRPIDTYNHASLRCMGYMFTGEVWRRMSDVSEEMKVIVKKKVSLLIESS